MRGFAVMAAVAVAGLVVSGCDSTNGYGSSPGTPTGPTAPPGTTVVTIDVVAIRGAQSFSPNPADLPAGQAVVWHNVDTTTHRVVLNDMSIDTGNLPPGASSRAMTIGGTGGGYHCAIHPEMVGTVNQYATGTAAASPAVMVAGRSAVRGHETGHRHAGDRVPAESARRG